MEMGVPSPSFQAVSFAATLEVEHKAAGQQFMNLYRGMAMLNYTYPLTLGWVWLLHPLIHPPPR